MVKLSAGLDIPVAARINISNTDALRLQMMSDDELVQATIAGDLSAFEELVRLLRYPLVSSAYHLTGNAEDAQDLAQETLVEGYRKLNTLRDGARVRGWLFTILRNKCLRYRERNRYQLVPLAECEEMPTPPPADESELLACLDRLPFSDREVIAARYLQELSYAEIAGALGISAHAVRVRCSRARERLRALILQAEEGRTRRVLQQAISLIISGTVSADFIHRVLQEVKPMVHLSTGGASSPRYAEPPRHRSLSSTQ